MTVLEFGLQLTHNVKAKVLKILSDLKRADSDGIRNASAGNQWIIDLTE